MIINNLLIYILLLSILLLLIAASSWLNYLLMLALKNILHYEEIK